MCGGSSSIFYETHVAWKTWEIFWNACSEWLTRLIVNCGKYLLTGNNPFLRFPDLKLSSNYLPVQSKQTYNINI